jgi:hypothetical protein
MSDAWTRAFVEAPWLASLLWLLLHGADWALTLAGARLRAQVLERAHAQPASAYELNPIFRADVAKLRFASPRFLASWIGVGAMLGLFFVLVRGTRDVLGVGCYRWFGVLLGVLVFTRVAILGRHLSNIYTFRLLLRTEARPMTQFDLQGNLRLSAVKSLEMAVLLGVCALLTADPWILGGTLGLALLAAKHLVLAGRTVRPPATAVAGQRS